MTQEELNAREAELKAAGYRIYKNTGHNAYDWGKTDRDPADHDLWRTIVTWRVWDWTPYIDRDPSHKENPYSMDACIYANLGDHAPAELEMPDILTIEQAEKLAKELYELTRRYANENNQD